MDLQRLGNNVRHPHARAERAVGVLEYHLDLAAVAHQLPPGEARDVLAGKANGSGGRGLLQQDQLGCRRFAASRLADEAQGLTRPDREIHPVHCLDPADLAPQQHPGVDREMLLESLQLKQWR